MKVLRTLLLSQILCAANAFVAVSGPKSATRLSSTTESAPTAVDLDPKEVVKVFGRLAEKYIMLDESGGMCCYSACKDCEFRLPDGGYRMADQSASRPKWIPVYEERVFEGQGKEHTAKWKTEIFPEGTTVVTKDEFVRAIVEMDFATPLGGPFVSKSAGKLDETETAAAEYLFEKLAGEKDKLTRHRMGLSLKLLADGEAGLTWAGFSAAMGL